MKTVDLTQKTAGFRSLVAWQEAKRLALRAYLLTKRFPLDERFHLVSQIRRASTSAMANIAEGSAMKTREHQNSYYTRARGSVIEVDNFADLIYSLQYITQQEYDDLTDHCARLSYLINQLIKGKTS